MFFLNFFFSDFFSVAFFSSHYILEFSAPFATFYLLKAAIMDVSYKAFETQFTMLKVS